MCIFAWIPEHAWRVGGVARSCTGLRVAWFGGQDRAQKLSALMTGANTRTKAKAVCLRFFRSLSVVVVAAAANEQHYKN